MKAKTLAEDNSVFKAAYSQLLEFISEVEIKFNTRVYVDSTTSVHPGSWLNICVYLHGDRNVVNLITIKMINWQHRHIKSWESHLYIYPAKDRERYER